VPEAKDLWSAMVEALKAQSLDLPDVLTHATRIEDLNADSLDLIEILMTIEEQLGLPTAFFDEQALVGLDTLGEAEIFLASSFVKGPRLM